MQTKLRHLKQKLPNPNIQLFKSCSVEQARGIWYWFWSLRWSFRASDEKEGFPAFVEDLTQVLVMSHATVKSGFTGCFGEEPVAKVSRCSNTSSQRRYVGWRCNEHSNLTQADWFCSTVLLRISTNPITNKSKGDFSLIMNCIPSSLNATLPEKRKEVEDHFREIKASKASIWLLLRYYRVNWHLIITVSRLPTHLFFLVNRKQFCFKAFLALIRMTMIKELCQWLSHSVSFDAFMIHVFL